MARWFILLFCMLGMCSCAVVPAREGKRPDEWAKGMEMEGVPNFYKVSDSLYRSSQPTAEGMRNLEKMGIKTVVNLRYFSSDDDRLAGTHMRAVRYPTLTWAPSEEHAAEFLQLMDDSSQGPFLIHCYHGSDRTGAMCALYRIKKQGWSYDAAVDEMRYGGYGFHKVWKNLPRWVYHASSR